MAKCAGTTKTGEACKANAMAESVYCRAHAGAAVEGGGEDKAKAWSHRTVGVIIVVVCALLFGQQPQEWTAVALEAENNAFAVAASAIGSEIDLFYVERKDIATQIQATLSPSNLDPTCKLAVIYGPRGSGKTTEVYHLLKGQTGVVTVHIKPSTKDIEEAIVATLKLKDGGNPLPTTDLQQVFKRAYEIHRAGKGKWWQWWRPTLHPKQDRPVVVLEMEDTLHADMSSSVVEVAKAMSCDWGGVVRVIVVMNDAKGSLVLNWDRARHKMIWVGDFTKEEARLFLKKRHVKMGTEEQEYIFANITTRAQDIIAAVDECGVNCTVDKLEKYRTALEWMAKRQLQELTLGREDNSKAENAALHKLLCAVANSTDGVVDAQSTKVKGSQLLKFMLEGAHVLLLQGEKANQPGVIRSYSLSHLAAIKAWAEEFGCGRKEERGDAA